LLYALDDVAGDGAGVLDTVGLRRISRALCLAHIQGA
jgi:hypothetical protein